MSDVGSNSLLTAFVELRAKAAANFESDASAQVIPGVQRVAAQANQVLATSGGGIKQMIVDAKAGAAATQEATAAQRAGYAAYVASAGAASETGNAVAGATPKLRGLGAAATSMSSAFGGAAGEATRLGSVLAYGGIAGAAAIGLAKLVEFGEGLNHTKLSLQELRDLAGKTSAKDLVGSTVTAFTFGDVNGQLKQLAESGATGVGTLLNLRDAYKAAGQDTAVFDKALEAARVSLLNTGTATDRGKAQLDAWGVGADAAKEAADRLAEHAKALTAAIDLQAAAATASITSTGSVEAAESRVADARDKVRVAGERLNGGVQREQAALASAVESASQRIVDAQQHIIDARQRVADAQEKLAHAGQHESLAVADAQDAVDAAQRKLNASTPEERAPAQHALDDARQKLADAKDALDRAKPDAERTLAEAVRGVADAARAEVDAHRSLRDAQDRQVEGSRLAEQAQRDYDAATRGVSDAVVAEAQAIADQKRIAYELATGLKEGPVAALGDLKQALSDLSTEFDPSSPLTARLLYILASLSGSQPEPTFGVPGIGGQVSRRAAGGPVSAGQVFMGAEYGPEMLLLNQGPGLYRSPGAGTVIPAPQTAQLGGHVHHHYTAIVQPVASDTIERAVRRELDRMESLRVLQGAGG